MSTEERKPPPADKSWIVMEGARRPRPSPARQAARRGTWLFGAVVVLLVVQLTLRVALGSDNPWDSVIGYLMLLFVALTVGQFSYARGYNDGVSDLLERRS